MSEFQYQQQWACFWPDRTHRKNVIQQIQQANLTYHSMTGHTAFFKYVMPAIENQKEEIAVIVGLSKSFPLVKPSVYAISSFSKPSIKDYRDILVELIGEFWSWQLRIIVVVQMIPQLMSKLKKLKGDYMAIQRIGQFCPRRYYDYKMLKELSQHHPFVCFENSEQIIKLRVLSVTSTHLLLFQPKNQPYFNVQNKLILPRQTELSQMKLIFQAELQSLADICHYRKNKNEYVFKFVAFELKKMEYTKHSCTKILSITRSPQFMQCLIKQMWHAGIIITIDVTSFQQNSIQQKLLSEAAKNQQKIKHYFNKDSLMQLIDSYQKLVQFYSAEGPPYQEIYVYKISMLYGRKDVQLVLNAYVN